MYKNLPDRFCLLCRHAIRFFVPLTIILVSISFPGLGQLPTGFTQKKLTDNTINEAISTVHAPDGRIFIAERGGKLKVFFNGNVSTVHTVSTITANEQGLLGIALHPQFPSNGKCYLFYTNPEKTFHYLDIITITPANQVSSVVRLMQFDRIINGDHNGGAMLFKDNFLYIAIGESNSAAQSQNLDTYQGKVLRLADDGQPAPGNPYFSQAGASRQRRSIWAIGLRNPWKMSIDPVTKKIFVIDVGGNYEEINDVTSPDPAKNYNYGWDERGRSGSEQPDNTIKAVFSYPHAGWGIAITSGMFFNPATTNYPEQYRNRFYFSDWAEGSAWLRSIDSANPAAQWKEFSSTGFRRIMGSSVGSDGMIYYTQYGTNGSLWRIEYNAGQAPSIVNQPASLSVFASDPVSFSVSAAGAAPFTYQWQKNGVNITGATSNRYAISTTSGTDAGRYRCVVTNAVGNVTSAEAVLTVEPFDAKPVAKIIMPKSSLTWDVMDNVNFSGTATDAEDGTLPPSAYQWEARFFHKENSGGEHWHPGPTLPSGVTQGSFPADNAGETSPNIWFRVLLTVTDSKGRVGQDSVDVFPNKVVLTAEANIDGIKLVLNGEGNAPFSKTFVVNSNLALQARGPQTVGETVYEFASWEHGGTASQILKVPKVNTVYKANYQVNERLQNPFSGSPIPLPGKLEAEHFDLGGESVAYHDATTGNSGGGLRPNENVDLEGCTEGGFNIGYVANGEWLEYTVDVTAAGSYRLDARVATPGNGKLFHVELDGINISGPIAVPVTGGFQAWQTVSVITPFLSVGVKTLRIVMESADFNINYLSFTKTTENAAPAVNITSPISGSEFSVGSNIMIDVSASDSDGTVAKVEFFQGATKLGEDLTSPYQYQWSGAASGTHSIMVKATDNLGLVTVSAAVSVKVNVAAGNLPYLGNPTAIPGRLEAENFDKGGESIAYHDTTPQNSGKDYRPDEGVDIENCTEGGFNIGYVATGEWLEYTLNVAVSGIYTMDVRVATPYSGKRFHVELEGQDISGPIAVPVTGGFQAWQTVTIQTPAVTQGLKVLRIVMESADFNINYLSFATVAPSISENRQEPIELQNDDPVADEKFYVYPNPVGGSLLIQGIEHNQIVHILDASGTRVATLTSVKKAINVSKLKFGTYFVEFLNAGKVYRRRFLKF